METLTLRTTYPCCGKPSRITALISVPVERYTRYCPQCDTAWDITRDLYGATPDLRIDRLVWTDMVGREYWRQYGTGA